MKIEKDLQNLREELLKWVSEIKKLTEKQVFAFDDFIKQYGEGLCDVCGKKFIAHYGGFYKTAYDTKLKAFTKIVCSSACMDKIRRA